jgi:hypothetical protein
MSDFTRGKSATRDRQDHVERGTWGNLQYIDGAGAVMSVRGTGTLDEEVPVMNLGYGFNLPQDSNSEVVMLSLGADVNDKVAVPTIPRDQQHQWPPGTGGVQNPTDPARRIEFNDDETWIKDGVYVYGHDRAQTVSIDGDNVTVQLIGGQTITIGADSSITIGGAMTLAVAGALTISAADIALESGTLTHNGVNISSTHRHGGVERGGANTDGPN